MTSIHELERVIEREDVTTLSHALGEPNVLIRRRAAQGLGELGRPESAAPLGQALHKDKDQYVVQFSIDALQKIGNETAIEALCDAAFGDRRDAAVLATQALAAIHVPAADAAFHIREMLQRNIFEGFEELGEESRAALSGVMRSQQFAGWPSGKRRPVLTAAVRLGVVPPRRYYRDLIEMGLFVGGLHTIGDLLAGLNHAAVNVRASAAEKLGESGQRWLTFALWGRFRREARSSGDRPVAIAAARALAALGDQRGIKHYQRMLSGIDVHAAAEAARALGEIGTAHALDALFLYGAEPPPPPAFHNIPQIMLALESMGPSAIDALKNHLDSDSVKVRQFFARILPNSHHAETISMLVQLALDTEPSVQQAALDGLAELNSEESAEAIFNLHTKLPDAMLLDPLAQITHPEGVAYLRELAPGVTVIHGTVIEERGEPLAGGYAQIVQEHYFGKDKGWSWEALTARAEANDEGEFWLTLLPDEEWDTLRLKITTPHRDNGADSTSYMTEIELIKGEVNVVRARVDHFVARLFVDVRLKSLWSSQADGS
jgi:HEAT repeat protein